MQVASESRRLRFFSSVLQFGNGCEKGRSPPFEAVCDRDGSKPLLPVAHHQGVSRNPDSSSSCIRFLRVRHSFAGQNSQSRGAPPP